MCRQDLVLGQDTIDGRAKRRVLVLQRDVPVDMVDVEVRADALADIPALLPQLLQGARTRNAVLPPHVERERRIKGRLPATRRAHAQPVRLLLLSFSEVRTNTDWGVTAG